MGPFRCSPSFSFAKKYEPVVKIAIIRYLLPLPYSFRQFPIVFKGAFMRQDTKGEIAINLSFFSAGYTTSAECVINCFLMNRKCMQHTHVRGFRKKYIL